jgi:pseudouridine-5'-phosphate glycosidase
MARKRIGAEIMHGAGQVIVAREVAAAVAAHRPVVALESTLIAQGLPWPDNLETARASEALVRERGAVPATVAVLGGRIRVGLSGAELEGLARPGRIVAKAGRRELSTVVGLGRDAATTVSATLWIARASRIHVVATGGLGGVHRDAATSFDVSADLDELARADGCLVVCSGAKAILDLPATLERLESLGVAVLGYRTDTLPAFTAASSGLRLNDRVDDPASAAAIVHAHRDLNLPGAILLTQPVRDDLAVPADLQNQAIAHALDQARARSITGPALTPFLLAAVRDATDGLALRANIALITANATLAAEIAVVLHRTNMNKF